MVLLLRSLMHVLSVVAAPPTFNLGQGRSKSKAAPWGA